MHLVCIMLKKVNFFSLIILLIFWINHSFAASFDTKLRDIRGEINRDNLTEAIKLLKKIKIGNELQQDKINILFGDIYLKINQSSKAEEFYEKSFFTTNKGIESLSLVGLAEVKLIQGKLNKAIEFSKQAISSNPDGIRPKIILAIAKTRIGEVDEAIKILNELYSSRKGAEVALAISDYYISFDDIEQALKILEDYLSRTPNHIKILDQIASLYLMNGNKKKAIEAKLKVFKFHEINKNKNKAQSAKTWIISVDPTHFDEPVKVEKIEEEKIKDYVEEEIENYDENKVTPKYEEFAFAPNGSGSGFIVGEGKYVITNFHVVDGAKRIAVRNGTGKATEAIVSAYSKDYDLAILELKDPYPKKFSIDSKDFADPKIGSDVISIGYPGIGLTFEQPTITQGIVSKVLSDKEGIFLTTAAINQGNSGGPIFNLNGKLVGVSFASLDKLNVFMDTGQIPTDMGFAIKSNMIKKVFQHKKSIPIKSIKFDKSTIYEKKLPSIALIVVLIK